MEGVHPAAQEARSLRLAQKHQAALALLDEALAADPGQPDLFIEKGLLSCLLQKEDEALELLEKGASSPLAAELFAWLYSYLDCRAQMAAKIGAKDEKGKALAKRVSRAANCQRPIEDPAEGKSKIGTANFGIRLSACLIVKNEEKHLERCLKSLEGHVDEIVVVDTGSIDGTVEIAKRFGAKIAEFAWCDDFSAARNISLELATGNWALWIDADEEVAPESWGPIREALIRPHFGGYFFKIVNYMDEEGTANTYTHAPVRLFQLRPEVRFKGRVHEQITPALDVLQLPCAQLSGACLFHYGYRPSEMAEKGKLDRTISLLEQEVRQAPHDAFHWFNLANTYSVARRHEDAVHAAKMCLKFIHPANSFGTIAAQILASGLTATGKPAEALAACEDAESRGFFSILNQFERAHALLNLGRNEDALKSVEACMAMPWDETMTGDYGIVTHKARTLRGQILTELGRFEEASADIEAALEVDPSFPVARFAKAVLLERTAQEKEALSIYCSLFGDPQFDYPARDRAIQAATKLGDWASAAEIGEETCRTYPLQLTAWAGYLGAIEAVGDSAKRQAAYQAFAEFHEPSADALVNWSRSLRELGELDAAYSKLQEAVEREPNNVNAHFNQGDLLYHVGMYADAAAAYESGLRYAPDSAQGWFVLGNCFAQLEVWDGARLAYRQALEIEPGHAEAIQNLAYVDESQKAA